MRRLLVPLAALFALNALGAPSAAQHQTIVVFAAASAKNAFDDIGAAFMRKAGIKVVASYAASSALIKQIEQGAPADVYLSADRDWMDYASERKLVQAGTRADLLGNRLVLIAPRNVAVENAIIDKNLDLARLSGGGRIVIGDVRAVPAGKYAKAALANLGLWSAVEKKLAMTENVRVALALVARGEAPLGIVYETDAKAEPAVKVIGIFPSQSHPAIVYPVALTAAAKPEAASFLAFLRSQEAKSIFERYGFSFLPEARP
ncbi:MAG: molybdate ABC transporter substrate-binding protein [Xanthobacteraceae bacterium]